MNVSSILIPKARVVCVDSFLDDAMSDEEFKSYLDMFPHRRPTDYLILGCTDNFEAQKRSSMLALKYGNPYLAAMMYAGGAAAELILLIRVLLKAVLVVSCVIALKSTNMAFRMT